MEKVSGLLKAFVIGAGVVLVIGTILLAILLFLRTRGGEVASSAPAAAHELLLPAGATVQQIVPDGRRLFLLGVDGTGAQFLAVVDAESGERLRLVRIRREGDGAADLK